MYKLTTLAVLLIAAPLAAQTAPAMDHSKMDHSKMMAGQPAMDHSKMDHSKMDHSKMAGGKKMDCMGEDGQCKMMAAGKNTPANPYAETSMASHKTMMAAIGTDASETWTRKMIEHHRSGVAMSKIALDKAQDKETLANARMLVAAQEKEIGVYQAWLKSRGKAAQ